MRQRRPSHLVSLLDPASPFPSRDDLDEARHLRVELHDIADEIHGYRAPAQRDVATILDFVGKWQRTDPILIHCYAGISRSTATAFMTACAHNPGIDEEEIALGLRAASKIASPNKLMVALADAELGRGGRMVRALEKIGPGYLWEDVGENTPFEIASRYGGAP
jgi:predicted protein tyrosine phosphatase